MNNMQITGIITLCAILFLAVVFLIALLYFSKKPIPEAIRYIEYDAEKIQNVFDKLIEGEFNFFSQLHPDYFQPGTAYLKPQDIKDITAKVSSRVFARITPALKNNLKFIYNFEEDSDLVNIIAEKVGMHVVALAASVNSSLVDEDINISKK